MFCILAEPASFDACGPDGSGASIDGKCFYLTSGSYSFVEAQQACVDLGGNLATIDSEDVQVSGCVYFVFIMFFEDVITYSEGCVLADLYRWPFRRLLYFSTHDMISIDYVRYPHRNNECS